MGYQVLARKWRPASFHEMVGQEHVLKALINALDTQRLHHAYLFTGTRGVGKTSIARLFAKALNCEQGVSSRPCGECTPCREISEGRFVDLIEVDAASRTKVEDTRELLENVQYAPTRGRYKVYLIDEVHMLSTSSFNALLKTLEEPPPHIKFLLATTDPQKLPVTILSRCLQFSLKNMLPERIVAHLQHVLQAEGVRYEEPALWLLARAANGSMRDALSLTDQAIAFCSGELTERDVGAMLGTVDQHGVLKLLAAVAEGEAGKVLAQVQELMALGGDADNILAELMRLLHRISIVQLVPGASSADPVEDERVRHLAARMRAEDAQLFYQIALNGRRDLPHVSDPREGLEMALLRMIAFRPLAPGEVALAEHAGEATETEPLSPPDNQGADQGVAGPEPDPAEDVAPPAPPVPLPERETMPPAWLDEVPPPEYEPKKSEPLPDPERAEQGSGEQHEPDDAPSAPDQPTAPEPEGKTGLPERVADLRPQHWIPLFRKLGLTGMTRSLAANVCLIGAEGSEVVLRASRHQITLFNQTQQERLADAMAAFFGEPVRVRLEEGEPEHETPAQYAERRRQERHAAAVEALEQDPTVQAVMAELGGELIRESVESLIPEEDEE